MFKLVFPDMEESQVNRLWRKELAKPAKEVKEDEDSGVELLE